VGVVETSAGHHQLKEALEAGKTIIVTTSRSFPLSLGK
jgi:hypothetical protein